MSDDAPKVEPEPSIPNQEELVRQALEHISQTKDCGDVSPELEKRVNSEMGIEDSES